MPCYRPIEVTIHRKKIYGNTAASQQVVPCGDCVGCRAEQGRQWAVRMMHESRMHQDNLFVTLTYNEERKPENGALRAKDFSGFVKRLRAAQEGPLSFFGCGEYGERTQRPHYHALFFGVKFLDSYHDVTSDRDNVWKSKTLEDLWGNGITEIGSVTMASASYVAGYIRKKVKSKDYVRANPITGEILTPEFARMSLRPAIGRRWIEEWWRDVYPRDYVVSDGYKAKPPRYYDKYMDKWDHEGGSQERRDLMERVRSRRLDEAIEMSTYTKMSAEKTLEARVKLFQGRDAL